MRYGRYTVLLLFAALPLGAQTSDAIIDRAVAAYAKMQSVRATFEQTITNPVTGRTITSRGELVRKQPNLLAVTFTNPKGDKIVADGKTVWVYLPSTTPGQVLRMGNGRDAMGSIDPVSQLLTSPKTRYRITGGGAAKVRGRDAHVVTLTPRQEGSLFTSATVWVDDDDGTIRQFEVVDANGLTRKVVVTTLKTNASISNSTFRFTPPKGTRIVDQASLTQGGR